MSRPACRDACGASPTATACPCRTWAGISSSSRGLAAARRHRQRRSCLFRAQLLRARERDHGRDGDVRRALRRHRPTRQRVRRAVSSRALRASRLARCCVISLHRVMKGLGTMELIPAIDLRDGRCVRLLKGDFAAETVYSDDPQSVLDALSRARRAARARRRSRRRARRHAAESPDCAAAREDQRREAAGRRRPAHASSAIRELFDAGVDRAVIGSIAVTDPDRVMTWMFELDPRRFVLALDVRLDANRRATARDARLAADEHGDVVDAHRALHERRA